MTDRRFLTLALAAALTSAACGGTGGGEWTGTLRDSAGIAIVDNPLEGTWAEAERPAVQEELRIGSLADPATAFGSSITGLAVDEAGAIYVLDQQAQMVRVFDADGTPLRTVGKPGTGPGELGMALAGAFLVRDTLFIPDMMNQRVNVYPPAGEPHSFPLDIMAGGIPMKWEALPDGRMVTQMRSMPLPGSGMTESGDRLVVRTTAGEVQDTLLDLPTGESFQMAGTEMRVRIFAAEPVWNTGPDGRVVYANNNEYRIHVASPQGELQRIITRAVERKPVTEADKEAIFDLIREQAAANGAPPAMVEPMLANMQFAENYPTMATVMAGPDGTVWAQRIRTAADFEDSGAAFDPNRIGSPEWDVFDGEGRYLGVVALPEGFQPFLWKDGRLYGSLRDDMDVMYVARLRVDGLPGAVTGIG